MIKHRGLNLQKFIGALPWDLFESYFSQLDQRANPGAWAWLNPSLLFDFLNDEQNAEVAGPILEDFQRMNDLGVSTSFLLYSFDRAGITWSQDEPVEAGAMRLFLQDREAFEYGWTLYLLQTTPGRRCEYYFPAGHLDPEQTQREQMKAFLSGWFSSIKRGEQCIPSFYKDDGRLYLRVARGRLLKTGARWKGQDITIETFRPASEDVPTYDPERRLLTLFGGNKRDRETYLHAFAEHIALRAELADQALATPVFSLEPFKDGTFSFAGNSAIRRIWIAKVGLVDDFGSLINVEGYQLRATLEARNLSLATMELRSVRLRMEIQTEGEKHATEVNVDIQPPIFSDLAQKRYGYLIEAYLRQQRVKLI